MCFSSWAFLFLDLCYESSECTDGQFCQIDEGQAQGECKFPDIENNSIGAGKVPSYYL